MDSRSLSFYLLRKDNFAGHSARKEKKRWTKEEAGRQVGREALGQLKTGLGGKGLL